jgi:hypothetical protein
LIKTFQEALRAIAALQRWIVAQNQEGTPPPTRLTVRDGEVQVDGKYVSLGILSSEKKREAILYLGCLTVADWKSDSEIFRQCPELDKIRLDRIRKSLPDEIRLVLKTHQAKGTRLEPVMHFEVPVALNHRARFSCKADGLRIEEGE